MVWGPRGQALRPLGWTTLTERWWRPAALGRAPRPKTERPRPAVLSCLPAGVGFSPVPSLVEACPSGGDLILFDYLAPPTSTAWWSNLFSLQWDPRVMHRATRIFTARPTAAWSSLDNEAGLGHGYRLLSVWDRYNEPLLRSVCVFREGTAARVRDLHRLRNAASELLRVYRAREPLAESLGFLSEQQARLLQERIDLVHQHILHCQAQAHAAQGDR
nr:PREDICTED: four-jointed box protein 1 [Anolis carolinensis]|eukprot:XP_008104183.1 PREDICTED: four-jointed box protein 1 [Anolis carolinensis]